MKLTKRDILILYEAAFANIDSNDMIVISTLTNYIMMFDEVPKHHILFCEAKLPNWSNVYRVTKKILIAFGDLPMPLHGIPRILVKRKNENNQ